MKRLNLVDRLYLLYLALIALLAIYRGPGATRVFVWHFIICFAILALAFNASHSPTLRFLHDWYPLPMFIFTFEQIAHFSLAVVPHWRDVWVLDFEKSVFGTSPNLWLAQFASPALSEFLDFGYFTYYPMFPLIAGILYAYGRRKSFGRLVLSAVLMYLTAFSIYLAFPLEGPRRALPGFSPPVRGYLFSSLVRLIQGGAGVHGNALPSSHVGLAVLCSIFAYRWSKKIGVVFGACTSLIAIGAVYDGYHYLSDVFAGLLVAGILGALAHRWSSET